MKGGMPEATNLIVDLRENHNLFCSVVVYPGDPEAAKSSCASSRRRPIRWKT